MNPFQITDYISPEFFCDREGETQKIISALENGRDVTLTSIRRMGKTGLIKNIFYHLKSQKNLKLIYVDILKTENMNEFIKAFADVLVKTESHNFMKKLSKLISGIRGKIIFDEMTGSPEVVFDYSDDSSATEQSMSRIFEFLAEQKEKYYIAFDEFQQIVNYPEKNVEAVLRTFIQGQHKDRFIFSGSSKHILTSMFNDYGRPFYQSSDQINLTRLDKDTYVDFIHHHFQLHKKRVDKSLILEYVENLDIYTFYVQYFFNRLFENRAVNINKKLAHRVFMEILAEREYIYIGYRNILTKFQYKLLKAIAKEGGIKKPNSGDFMKKHNFFQQSSINKALKSLLEKEMIYNEDGEYRVYDLFLSKWLERA
jgi:hypothetical protein